MNIFLYAHVFGVLVVVFDVSLVACDRYVLTHHRMGIEQAMVMERSVDESVPQIVEVASEQIVDVFVPARLRLACRHTSQARKPRAV